MPAFADKFTSEQRDACAEYKVDRGLSAKDVATLAQAGELRYNGEKLEPFTITASYVADLGAKLKRRRAGKVQTPLADQPTPDAVETLRRRLLNMAAAEIEHEEKKKPGTRSPNKAQQWARALFEVRRLPEPTEPRPASPGTRDSEGKRGPVSTGGAAGALLKDHRGAGQATDPAGAPGDGSGPDDAGPDDGSPGALVAAAVARMS